MWKSGGDRISRELRFADLRICTFFRGSNELTQVERQVHVVRVLDALEHGLGLPPRGMVRVVQIGEVMGGVVVPSAHVAALLVRIARLLAELHLGLFTARIRRMHGGVVSCIFKLRDAALGRGNAKSLYFNLSLRCEQNSLNLSMMMMLIRCG